MRLKGFFVLLAVVLLAGGVARGARVSAEQARSAAESWLAESADRLGSELSTTIERVDDYGTFFAAQLDPQGFIILSADTLVEPVIVFSDNGRYVEDPENPLTTMLGVDMSNRLTVADALEAGAPTDSDDLSAVTAVSEQAAQRWVDLLAGRVLPDGSSSISDVRIAPFVTSEWNQGSAQGQYCYNYYTPSHYVAGCVAIAMAQVMRYYQFPTDGIGVRTNTISVNGSSQSATTRGGNGSGGAYDWNEMPLSPGTATYDADQWRMIGALCYDAGVACGMSYSSGGSSASYWYATLGMTDYFGYSNAKYTYSSSGLNYATRQKVLMPNLILRQPVMLGVRRSGGGHAIVCDGYGFSSSTEYHHMNMGWGGYYDAWYNLPTVDAGSYVYTLVDAATFNMYTNGTGELIGGRVLTDSSLPVGGAIVTASGGYSGQTDSNGYYAIRVPASATYSLTAVHDDYADGSLGGVAVGSSSYPNIGNYWGANITMKAYSFKLTAFALTNNVVLRWTAPAAVGMDGATCLVRRATSGYPATTADGTEAYKGTNHVYTDNGLTPGQVYYYTIWMDDGSGWVTPPGT